MNIQEILRLHALWIQSDSEGKRADLHSADLRGADLHSADLSGADLRGANLRGAYLRDANLRDADLRDANLSGANLSGANLRDANLRGANLSGANLSGADLHSADITDTKFSPFLIVPEEGEFIGWKKVYGAVLKILIPIHAKRISALVSRKCRASEARVLEAFTDQIMDPMEFHGIHNPETIYRVGETVKSKRDGEIFFSDDIREECAPGIHFFVTRQEAEEFVW